MSNMAIDKVKILVTGANGQVGSELRVLSKSYSDFNFFFAGREDFDLEIESEMIAYLDRIVPAIIVNCAAYTAVDKAETETVLADKINNIAVGIIAKWAFQNHCKLIHISTDYVFDGTSAFPLAETDHTNPINFYGETKLRGENSCLENNPLAIIIRTSWVYSEFGNNFVKTMLRLMQVRDSINVVNDQIGSPTYAADLALVILKIIASGKWHAGIYHFSNEGEISWYDFAVAIKELNNNLCEVVGIPSSDFPTPAKRPKYSLLNKEKIKQIFDVDVESYGVGLSLCINKIEKSLM